MVRPAIEKEIYNALSFLENKTIRACLFVILIIYNSAMFKSVNVGLSTIFNNIFVKCLMLLVIITVGVKDRTLALLLAIALVISVFYGNNLSIENMTAEQKDDMKKNMINIYGEAIDEADKSIGNRMTIHTPGSEEPSNLRSMTTSELIEQDNDAKKKLMQLELESFDQQKQLSQPLGFNSNTDCVNVQEDATQCERTQCDGIKMFTNELGAQGMATPAGYSGNHYANV